MIKESEFIRHLPVTEAVVSRSSETTPYSGQLKFQMIKVGGTVAIGPPQTRMIELELGKLFWQQIEDGIARGTVAGIFHLNPSNAAVIVTCLIREVELCIGRCSSTSAEEISGMATA